MSLIFSLFLLNADRPLTDYELQHMRKCFRNNAKMRQLGLPVLARLFANTRISLEIQQQKETENSGSEYGEDEPNSDGHLSDDGLEPETEVGCTLASLLYKVLVIPQCQILICGLLAHCI